VQIWQSNCSGRRVLRAPMDASKEQFNAVNGRSLIQVLVLLHGNDLRYFAASASNWRVR